MTAGPRPSGSIRSTRREAALTVLGYVCRSKESTARMVSLDDQRARIADGRAEDQQVLLNPLSNAIKFTAEGGRIDVAAKPVDGSVSVTDTGVGIAREGQEATFEEFKQARTAAKEVEGTGLRLGLSRRFVELHDGRIWVKREVGIGSTFTFTIPVSAHGIP